MASRRRRYRGKRYHRRSKRIALGVTLGGLATTFKATATPAAAPYVYRMSTGALSSSGQMTTLAPYQWLSKKYASLPMATRLENAGRAMYAKMSELDTYVPIVAGVVLSWAGKKMRLNKYVHKIPVVGREVNL